MKTTVEISDDLALSLKDELKKSGLSMRTALDEALRSKIPSLHAPQVAHQIVMLRFKAAGCEFFMKIQ